MRLPNLETQSIVSLRLNVKMQNYFQILGIPKKLSIDSTELEKIYHDLSKKNHPDFFLNQGEDKYLDALETSSQINQGYKVLKDPLARVHYILELDAPQLLEERDKSVAPDLLMKVMEIQETIERYHEVPDREKEAIINELADIKNDLNDDVNNILDDINREFEKYDEAAERKKDTIEILMRLKTLLHKRNYINTLIHTINAEVFGGEKIKH